MKVKDGIVKMLNKYPDREFGSGEIQDRLKVNYPLSNPLSELADAGLIKRVSRGVFTAAGTKKTTTSNGRAPANGRANAIVGEIRQTAVLTTHKADVVLELGTTIYTMPWAEFVSMMVEKGTKL